MKAMMRLGAITALLLVAMMACAAQQAAAQAPTFLLQWGSQGTGPGQFDAVIALAVAPNGNVYTLDAGNNRVTEFTSTGQFITQWGALGTAAGQFSYPRGIAVDAAGSVYVADTRDNRIQKFTASGAFLMQWGRLGSDPGCMRSPWSVAVDASGSVYVGCGGVSGIQKYASDSTFVAQWTASATGALGTVYGIAIDPAGDVYAAHDGNGSPFAKIDKFSSAGLPLRQYAKVDYYAPFATAVNAAGVVYFVNAQLATIFIYAPDGSTLATMSERGSGPGALANPNGIAVGPAGEFYVADSGNYRVQKFSATAATPAHTGTWGQLKGLYR